MEIRQGDAVTVIGTTPSPNYSKGAVGVVDSMSGLIGIARVRFHGGNFAKCRPDGVYPRNTWPVAVELLRAD